MKLRRRETLAGAIRHVATDDTFAAVLLASRGRKFTEMETLLNLYFQTLDECRGIEAGNKSKIEKIFEDTPEQWTRERAAEHRAYMEKTLQDFQREISQIIFKAINARDSEKIIEIANAVDFLKSYDRTKDADPVRVKILIEKCALETTGEKMKIGHLAKLIEWPKSDAENGYCQLRRICAELRFPLAKSKQISLK